MLFSNPAIARLVREHFVAAWENVRPVPVVEIDFGNGTKIKRTVNGNIALYVCAPDGRVLDIIPGLNSPEATLDDLRHALNLYRAGFAKGADFEKVVREYHAANLAAPTTYEWVVNDMAKTYVERLMRISLDKRHPTPFVRVVPGPDARLRTDSGKWEVELPVRGLTAEETRILAADTELNRKERKPILHRILAEKIVRPAEITKRIYKDVLHCDLDDPTLGLVSKAFDGGAYETP